MTICTGKRLRRINLVLGCRCLFDVLVSALPSCFCFLVSLKSRLVVYTYSPRPVCVCGLIHSWVNWQRSGKTVLVCYNFSQNTPMLISYAHYRPSWHPAPCVYTLRIFKCIIILTSPAVMGKGTLTVIILFLIRVWLYTRFNTSNLNSKHGL